MVAAEAGAFLPEELARKIRDFMKSGKTGKVIFNFHEGCIKSWELSEMGRIHESAGSFLKHTDQGFLSGSIDKQNRL